MTPYPYPEFLLCEGVEYYIVGMTNGSLLTPHDFGIKSELSLLGLFGQTYITTHKIENNKLYVDKFEVASSESETSFEPINDVYPTVRLNFHETYDPFLQRGQTYRNHSGLTYFDLNIEENYTGGMIVGANNILSDFPSYLFVTSVHWYESVLEILFHMGSVLRINDHSKIAQQARELERTKKNSFDDIEKLMTASFTQSYYPRGLAHLGDKKNNE